MMGEAQMEVEGEREGLINEGMEKERGVGRVKYRDKEMENINRR